jgi:hypothetical protein
MRLVFQNLWRHRFERAAECHPASGKLSIAAPSEVGHFDDVIGRHQKIGELEITVRNASLVQIPYAFRHLRESQARRIFSHPSLRELLDDLTHRAFLAELELQEDVLWILVKATDTQDILVRQTTLNMDLLVEAPEHTPDFKRLFFNDLHGIALLRSFVTDLPNHRVRAVPEIVRVCGARVRPEVLEAIRATLRQLLWDARDAAVSSANGRCGLVVRRRLRHRPCARRAGHMAHVGLVAAAGDVRHHPRAGR